MLSNILKLLILIPLSIICLPVAAITAILKQVLKQHRIVEEALITFIPREIRKYKKKRKEKKSKEKQ